MTSSYNIPELPLKMELETKEILKQLSNASRALAELKGVAKTIPNENILLNTLVLQEAKDSSEIENIVTTQDDLYKTDSEIDDIKKTVENIFIEFKNKSAIIRLPHKLNNRNDFFAHRDTMLFSLYNRIKICKNANSTRFTTLGYPMLF